MTLAAAQPREALQPATDLDLAAVMALDDPQRIVETLEDALSRGESIELHEALAQAYRRQSRCRSAANHLHAAAELARDRATDIASRRFVAARLAILGHGGTFAARLIDELNLTAASPRGSVDILLDATVDTALDAARIGDWTKFDRHPLLLDKLTPLAPDHPGAALVHGFMAQRAGDVVSARERVSAAVQWAANAEVIESWTDHLRYHHDFELAQRMLTTAHCRWPEADGVTMRLAATYAELGSIAQAQALWAGIDHASVFKAEAEFMAAAAACALTRRPVSAEQRARLACPPPDAYTLDFSALQPAALRDVLDRYGLAIVRGGLSGHHCDELVRRFTHHIEHTYYAHLPAAPRDEINVPLHFLCAPEHAPLLHEHFAPIVQRPIGAWHWDLEGKIPTADVWQMVASLAPVVSGIEAYLRGPIRAEPSLAYARAKMAGQPRVLPFHQDARTGYWTVPTVAVWIPLTACGDRAPGLQVVPQRMRTFFPVCLYEHQQRPDFQDYPASAKDELIPESLIATPQLSPGDLLVFDTFVLHRTQRVPEQAAQRINFDVRFTRIPEQP